MGERLTQKPAEQICGLFLRKKRRLFFVLEHAFHLRFQLRRVLVAVVFYRVVNGKRQNFFFGARNCEGAIFLTRHFSAIRNFSLRHIDILFN